VVDVRDDREVADVAWIHAVGARASILDATIGGWVGRQGR
jgi:hypothetical protein